MKVIIAEVFNGEGYSEPSLGIFENDSKEMFDFIEKERMGYAGDFDQTDGEEENVVYSFEGHDEEACDSGAIISLEIKEEEGKKAIIVMAQPQECNVALFDYYDSLEEAREALSVIVNSINYDEDDVEEFNDEPSDSFGSHGDDNFDYYEIFSL